VSAQAYVVTASVSLGEGCDPRTVGAEVTVALCGHWEHEGACRRAHNSAIELTAGSERLRTLFVAHPEEEAEVRGRIGAALAAGPGWTVAAAHAREVAEDEEELARRLLGVGEAT